jgi:hypothetical protein
MKTTTNCSQFSLFPNRDWNQVPPKHKSKKLPLEYNFHAYWITIYITVRAVGQNASGVLPELLASHRVVMKNKRPSEPEYKSRLTF